MHALSLRRAAALAALMLAPAACGHDAPTTPSTPVRDLYVDPAAGSDARDGTAPSRAVRTLARALSQIPDIPGGRWTLHLAPGRYAETVRLERFSMPSDLSQFQVQSQVLPEQSIALVGDSAAPESVVLAPPDSTSACVVASGVVLYLDGLTCAATSYGGVLGAGSSLVMDDVRFVVAGTSSRSALYLDRSTALLGGRVTVDGPFAVGFAVRSWSLLRSGTPRNPLRLTAVFRGGVGDGIFLRDYGDVTTAFETDTFYFDRTRIGVHALLGSIAFFTNTVEVRMDSVGTAFHASEGSGINVHHVTLRGVSDVFGRCRYNSFIAVETGDFGTIGRYWDGDGSCTLRAGTLTGS